MNECRHGLQPTLCVMCRNDGAGHVYVAGTGPTYHSHKRCTALTNQAKTGGGIERVALASETVAGRTPCVVCKPQRRT